MDPWVLVKELRALKAEGMLKDSSRLVLCERATLILPYHKALDHLREAAAGEGKIGTTGRGIGPAYEDAVGRRSVRLGLLNDWGRLRSELEKHLREKNALIAHYGGEPIQVETVLNDLAEVAEEIRP